MRIHIIKFVAIMLLFAASSCENFEKPEEDGFYINAKVENASEYSNVAKVKLMVYNKNIKGYVELTSNDWKGYGFTSVLPTTIDPNYLDALNISGYWINLYTPSTMTVSNTNVKVLTVSSSFTGVDKDGTIVAFFQPYAIDEKSNVKDFFYTYVDSDVTISGYSEGTFTVIATEDYTRPYLWKNTTTYSIVWKKGWNVWWISRAWDTLNATETEEYSSSPIKELKWQGKFSL